MWLFIRSDSALFLADLTLFARTTLRDTTGCCVGVRGIVYSFS